MMTMKKIDMAGVVRVANLAGAASPAASALKAELVLVAIAVRAWCWCDICCVLGISQISW